MCFYSGRKSLAVEGIMCKSVRCLLSFWQLLFAWRKKERTADPSTELLWAAKRQPINQQKSRSTHSLCPSTSSSRCPRRRPGCPTGHTAWPPPREPEVLPLWRCGWPHHRLQFPISLVSDHGSAGWDFWGAVYFFKSVSKDTVRDTNQYSLTAKAVIKSAMGWKRYRSWRTFL